MCLWVWVWVVVDRSAGPSLRHIKPRSFFPPRQLTTHTPIHPTTSHPTTGAVDRARPREMFCPLPVVLVRAVTAEEADAQVGVDAAFIIFISDVVALVCVCGMRAASPLRDDRPRSPPPKNITNPPYSRPHYRHRPISARCTARSSGAPPTFSRRSSRPRAPLRGG